MKSSNIAKICQSIAKEDGSLEILLVLKGISEPYVSSAICIMSKERGLIPLAQSISAGLANQLEITQAKLFS